MSGAQFGMIAPGWKAELRMLSFEGQDMEIGSDCLFFPLESTIIEGAEKTPVPVAVLRIDCLEKRRRSGNVWI